MGYRGHLVALLVVVIACGACGSASDRPMASGGEPGAGSPGSAGNAGSVAGPGGASGANGGSSAGQGGATSGGSGNSAGASGAQAGQCPELPVARRSTGTVLELPIEPMLQGKPLLFGQSNSLSDGSSLTPLDIRFYVSEVALLRDSAEAVPVDLVTAQGNIAPYGVHLYSADDAASNTLRVLAPPGQYIGIQFLLGLTFACNKRSPDGSVAPLSPTSQMSWPHTGFLFLRYQGRTTTAAGASSGGAGGSEPASTTPSFPSVIHMGGSLAQDLTPLVQVSGVFSVPASGPFSKGLRFVLDEVFKGAETDVDLTGFAGPPGEEVVLGERLRRNMAGLHLFALDP